MSRWWTWSPRVRDVAGEGLPAAVDGEAEPLVQPDGGGVVGVDVEVGLGDAAIGDRVEPGERELFAEPVAVEVGIDGDHVDLADDGVEFVVELRPAERGQPTVDLVQPEPRRVEPRLVHAEGEDVGGPSALFAVFQKGAVVDREPGRVVVAGNEVTGLDRGPDVERERSAHLVETANGCQAMGLGERTVGIGGVVDPPEHAAATGARERVEGGLGDVVEHDPAVVDVGADERLERRRVVGSGDLRQRDRTGLVGRDHRDEPVATAAAEIEPEVVGERPVAGRRSRALDELGECPDLFDRRPLQDLDRSHQGRRVPGSPGERGARRHADRR